MLTAKLSHRRLLMAGAILLSTTASALFVGSGSASASPCLNESACGGVPWPEAVIGANIADQAPAEAIAFVFGKIEVVYHPQKPDGTD